MCARGRSRWNPTRVNSVLRISHYFTVILVLHCRRLRKRTRVCVCALVSYRIKYLMTRGMWFCHRHQETPRTYRIVCPLAYCNNIWSNNSFFQSHRPKSLNDMRTKRLKRAFYYFFFFLLYIFTFRLISKNVIWPNKSMSTIRVSSKWKIHAVN